MASGLWISARSGIVMKSMPPGGSWAAADAVARAWVTEKSSICLSRNAPRAGPAAPEPPGNGQLNSIRLTVAAQLRHRQRTMSAASTAWPRPDGLPQANSAPPPWLAAQKAMTENESSVGMSVDPCRAGSVGCAAGWFRGCGDGDRAVRRGSAAGALAWVDTSRFGRDGAAAGSTLRKRQASMPMSLRIWVRLGSNCRAYRLQDSASIPHPSRLSHSEPCNT